VGGNGGAQNTMEKERVSEKGSEGGEEKRMKVKRVEVEEDVEERRGR